MKIKVLTLFAVVALCLSVFSPFLVKIARAASTGTVSATVTAIIYSVSLDNGDGISFGSVAQSSAKDTTTAGVNDSTTAASNGSVPEKLNIKAGNSTGGAGWTLASSAGSEQYTMKSCTSDCDGSPVWTSVGIDPAYATLVANIGVGSSQPFDLQVGTPTSTTVTDQQSITVTVQATAL